MNKLRTRGNSQSYFFKVDVQFRITLYGAEFAAADWDRKQEFLPANDPRLPARWFNCRAADWRTLLISEVVPGFYDFEGKRVSQPSRKRHPSFDGRPMGSFFSQPQ